MSKRVQSNGSKQPGGVTGKGFKPGTSGNPGGQPAWVREVRAAMEVCVADGAAYLQRVIRGETFDYVSADGRKRKLPPRHEHRLKAVELALTWTLGKPKQALELSGPGGTPLELGRLSDDDLGKLEEILTRADASTQP